METIISDLVKRFEGGKLTRRELIQGLAMLTAASSAGLAAEPQGRGGLKTMKIDHISIQVTDLPRAIAFYQDLFGLVMVSEDKPNEIFRLGIPGTTKTLVSLHHKSPTGLVDHYAIGIESFNKDAVTQMLKQRGLTPMEDIDAGFHVKDPEGIRVQIVQG
jgi:catechol 2,3-dioxygenase-like lactoylglutathione lyase family enzyme